MKPTLLAAFGAVLLLSGCGETPAQHAQAQADEAMSRVQQLEEKVEALETDVTTLKERLNVQ